MFLWPGSEEECPELNLLKNSFSLLAFSGLSSEWFPFTLKPVLVFIPAHTSFTLFSEGCSPASFVIPP